MWKNLELYSYLIQNKPELQPNYLEEAQPLEICLEKMVRDMLAWMESEHWFVHKLLPCSIFVSTVTKPRGSRWRTCRLASIVTSRQTRLVPNADFASDDVVSRLVLLYLMLRENFIYRLMMGPVRKWSIWAFVLPPTCFIFLKELDCLHWYLDKCLIRDMARSYLRQCIVGGIFCFIVFLSFLLPKFDFSHALLLFLLYISTMLEWLVCMIRSSTSAVTAPDTSISSSFPLYVSN